MANGMGGLYVGASGLQSSQNALNTTANNLSNLDTIGYVRQQVLMTDKSYSNLRNTTQKVTMAQSGLGVDIGDVVHSRDIFLDKYYRTEAGRQAFYNTCANTTDEIQTQLQEMEGQAFQDVLGEFYVSFQEIAKDPSSAVNQNLLVQKASLFIERSQALYKSLSNYQVNMNRQIGDTVTQINTIGKNIAGLNEEIQKIEAGGVETAMDLRDARDQLLDQLSKLGNITYNESADGVVKVKFEGVEFIDEMSVHTMQSEVDGLNGFIVPTWKELSDPERGIRVEVFQFDTDISTELNTDIGKLKALVMNRGTEISDYLDVMGLSQEEYSNTTGMSAVQTIQAQLDQMVHGVVTAVNQILSPTVSQEITVGGLTQTVHVWDAINGAVGKDKKGPGQELFSRNFDSRYREVIDDAGKTWYVYNEEDTGKNAYGEKIPVDTTTLYSINNITVNPILIEDETKLPSLTANGDIDYNLGKQLGAVWDQRIMKLTPGDENLCAFSGYYERMVLGLASNGTVFTSISNTLSSSVAGIENQRQGVIGVSSDEELTNMIKYQNAYNAASRYINVVDAMIEHLVTQLGA
ncbi:MAG: flagellar hook-associated protein FlgK [Lachnospiraceae bacterium]